MFDMPEFLFRLLIVGVWVEAIELMFVRNMDDEQR
jgi:hypothetical protein